MTKNRKHPKIRMCSWCNQDIYWNVDMQKWTLNVNPWDEFECKSKHSPDGQHAEHFFDISPDIPA